MIPIWLIALVLAAQAIPRRLIYIVNRRTVVDQASTIAARMRERLKEPPDGNDAESAAALRELTNGLRMLCAFGSGEVLGVSTLRGELADNEEWKKDPARSAIIIGTIDMIGSKVLFSGYGDRRYGRAHHAGLIGQDALIVHDEAHLAPAFGELLISVRDEQAREQRKDNTEIGRRVVVIELSATARRLDEKPVTLLPQDEEGDSDPAQTVRERLDAEKHLRLHLVDPKHANEKVIELAAQNRDSQTRVLVYLTKPEDAKTIAKYLRERHTRRVELLTGTLRGYERDGLVKTHVLQEFLGRKPTAEPAVLVSTSAGEVGIDLDADHMVCDLTTLDSLIQRLGRVNRRGGRSSRVDVVVALDEKDTSPRAAALAATRRAIEQLPKYEDGSSKASVRAVTALLKELGEDQKRAAFQQQPAAVAATDILFDAWSLTSIHGKMPGRPEVAAFLHGITNNPPETYVAWRAEVAFFEKHDVDNAALRDWFRACRIKSHELLRDSTDRVVQHLNKIKSRTPERLFILLSERGEVEKMRLDELPANNDEALAMIRYKTVVLPVESGGLTDGILDGAAKDPATDVAEEMRETHQMERKRQRLYLEFSDGDYQAWSPPAWERAEAPELHGAGRRSPRDAASQILGDEMRVMHLLTLAEPAEGSEEQSSKHLVLLMDQDEIDPEDSENAPEASPPNIRTHTDDVVGRVREIVRALKLDDELRKLLLLAAELHDLGKARLIWQRAIHNDPTTGDYLAKPTAKGMDWRKLDGYRHEFGSLLDATGHEKLRALSDDERDLVLHLIAAHHGHGRPHFDSSSFNFEHNATTEQNEDAAREAMRRFARLQMRYGRWHLAWLESLLRCADASASAEPSSNPTASVKPS